MNKRDLMKAITINKKTNTITIKGIDLSKMIVDIRSDVRGLRAYIVKGDNVQRDIEGNNLQRHIEGNNSQCNVGGNNYQWDVGGDNHQWNVGGKNNQCDIGGSNSQRDIGGVNNQWNIGGDSTQCVVEGDINHKGNNTKSRVGDIWYDNVVLDGINQTYLKKTTKLGITIYKLHPRNTYEFAITNGVFSAHGDTLEDAKSSLRYKIKTFKENKLPIIELIKKKQTISREDYRKLTGACEAGVRVFCEEHNILEDTKEIPLDQLIEIMKNEKHYGGDVLIKYLAKNDEREINSV